MKKFLLKVLGIAVLLFVIYGLFIYFATYSEGIRAGELIKFSSKGVVIKTWEGEISQGVSDGQIFSFSVQKNKKQVVEDLQRLQGKYVKLHYFERYKTFFWLGETKYFITEVVEDVERSNRRL